MLYRFKIKNRLDQYVTIDEQSYKYFTEDPVFKEMKILENLRAQIPSEMAFFQKWYRNSANQPYLETVYLHKAIAEKFIPRTAPNAKYVAHINSNKLDNRIENLIWVTRSELNRYGKLDSETGYRCVKKDGDKFKATIYIDKKPIHLGSFDTAEEAANAYNEAAIRHNVVRREVNNIKIAAKAKETNATKINKPKK